MTILQAAILGVVEGLTEFLPISSTGHLILAEKLLGIPTTDFVKTFDIAIQSGAILAVLLLMADRLLKNRHMMLLTVLAFLPTAAIGFLLGDSVKTHLLGNTTVVAWALLLGGFAFLWLEWTVSKRTLTKKIGAKQSVWVGIAQSIALFPGVSRSGATIFGGMLFGIPRAEIVEFSFFLAIPTIIAATGFDLLKTNVTFGMNEWLMLCVGFAFSFISALLAIRWLLSYVKTHTFVVFGIYRILVGLLFLLFVR